MPEFEDFLQDYHRKNCYSHIWRQSLSREEGLKVVVTSSSRGYCFVSQACRTLGVQTDEDFVISFIQRRHGGSQVIHSLSQNLSANIFRAPHTANHSILRQLYCLPASEIINYKYNLSVTGSASVWSQFHRYSVFFSCHESSSAHIIYPSICTHTHMPGSDIRINQNKCTLIREQYDFHSISVIPRSLWTSVLEFSSFLALSYP